MSKSVLSVATMDQGKNVPESPYPVSCPPTLTCLRRGAHVDLEGAVDMAMNNDACPCLQVQTIQVRECGTLGREKKLPSRPRTRQTITNSNFAQFQQTIFSSLL